VNYELQMQLVIQLRNFSYNK